MKNEQNNNQNNSQDQPVKNPGNQKEQGHDKQQQTSNQYNNTGKGDQSKTNKLPKGQGNDNLAVNNEGKIGKAHQWDNDNNNRNENDEKNNQVRSDKTSTGPEIDAPIYDPEKTEKKIPQMQANKDKK